MKNYRFVVILLVLTCCKVEDKESAENINFKNENYQIDIPCFVYHRIGDGRYPSTNTPTDLFEGHLKYLVNNDFEFITLSKAIQIIDNKESKNKKYVVITIDDGFRSFYKNGFPLLKKYHATATLFVNTKTVGDGGYMSWNELKSLARAGIEIGNHSHSHPFFLNIPQKQRLDSFRFEVEKAQEMIKVHLETEPVVFAYPYGEFDEEMRKMIRESGFKGAAAQNSGILCEQSDVYAIPRFPMGTAFAGMSAFKQKAEMKALRVVEKSPDHIFFKQNPPELTVSVDTSGLVRDRIQAFVYGNKTPVEWLNSTTVKIKYSKRLTARRTLYTITVPSRKNEWYWFSHLWVNPQVADQ